jgi:hypothetical protein
MADVFAFHRSRIFGFVLFVPVLSILIFLQQVGVRLFGECSSEILIGVSIGVALAIGFAGVIGKLLA